MSPQAIAYYARKFFPHMLPAHSEAIVRLMWDMHNSGILHKP